MNFTCLQVLLAEQRPQQSFDDAVLRLKLAVVEELGQTAWDKKFAPNLRTIFRHLVPPERQSEFVVQKHRVWAEEIIELAEESGFKRCKLSDLDPTLSEYHSRFKCDIFAYRNPVDEAIKLVERAKADGHHVRLVPAPDDDDDGYVYSSAETSDRFREYYNAVVKLGLPGLLLLALIL